MKMQNSRKIIAIFVIGLSFLILIASTGHAKKLLAGFSCTDRGDYAIIYQFKDAKGPLGKFTG
ncbi:hypothetical protein DRJ16_07370, partial [Candidatus Woesearchaeota archaeon]